MRNLDRFAINGQSIWLSALILLGVSNFAQADSSSFLAMFRKKPTVSAEQLELKAEHGPWLILAATISGDDAHAKASNLANEIRATMRVPAFVMHRTTNASNAVLGVGERIRTERNGQLVSRQLKKRYANGIGTEAYAVLVGEFSSTDDPRVKDVLAKIRVAQPSALGTPGKPEKKEGSENDTAWLVRKSRALIW